MMTSKVVCSGLYDHKSPRDRCDYLMSHEECSLGGLLNYIGFFYCVCMEQSFLGYIALAGWLVALFYLLGNTAADYFCCSLEKLSDILELPPTIAGVSLLPLGNGAPDVFATIAAFVGTGSSGEVGLNSVLGGAVFVVCIVVGVVSLSVSSKKVQIDRSCFIRDLCFFLFAMLCLFVIVVIGNVTIGGAIAFLSLYAVYGFSVVLKEVLSKRKRSCKFSLLLHGNAIDPLLPVVVAGAGGGGGGGSIPSSTTTDPSEDKLAHWIWASNVAIYSDHVKVDDAETEREEEEEEKTNQSKSWSWSCCRWVSSCSNIWWLMEMPLTIPRRLTIPVVEEERWSKCYAVASSALSPVLVAFLWSTLETVRDRDHPSKKLIGYLIGIMVGSTLGGVAFVYTKPEHPPRRKLLLLAWVLGGFFMSIIWFYIIAKELVALLVSLGVMLGINPSLLALTILAWGNSMGDLMSNTALAMNNQRERDDGVGVQIAMSGCYAGPMFNVLVGLGISMVLGAWSGKPEPYVLPRDTSLYFTMGFLVLGLIWALIVLPTSDMQPNKILGVGLIAIYLMFLCFRVGTAIGVVS
ncbi:hypothetical protein Dimus_002510 [Dionaea muscipula]